MENEPIGNPQGVKMAAAIETGYERGIETIEVQHELIERLHRDGSPDSDVYRIIDIDALQARRERQRTPSEVQVDYVPAVVEEVRKIREKTDDGDVEYTFHQDYHSKGHTPLPARILDGNKVHLIPVGLEKITSRYIPNRTAEEVDELHSRPRIEYVMAYMGTDGLKYKSHDDRKSFEAEADKRIKEGGARINNYAEVEKLLEMYLGDLHDLDIKRVGSGGMAIAYRATRKSDPKKVYFVKVARRGCEDRLISEFNTQRRISQDPNELDAYFGAVVGLPGGQRKVMMATEYVLGEDEQGNQVEPIELKEFNETATIGQKLEAIVQVLQSLERAHKKCIAHLDVKPDNVMVTKKGNRDVAHLIDYGVSLPLTTRRSDVTIGGSPMYLPPQTFDADSMVRPSDDVYSASMVLYEMLTGVEGRISLDREYEDDRDQAQAIQDAIQSEVHFTDPDPEALEKLESLDPKVIAILQKGLMNDTLQRYRSAREMIEDLEEVMLSMKVVTTMDPAQTEDSHIYSGKQIPAATTDTEFANSVCALLDTAGPDSTRYFGAAPDRKEPSKRVKLFGAA